MSTTLIALPDPKLTISVEGKTFHEGEYIPLYIKPEIPEKPALFPPERPEEPKSHWNPAVFNSNIARYHFQMQQYQLGVNRYMAQIDALDEEEKATHLKEVAAYKQKLRDRENLLVEQASGSHGRFTLRITDGPIDTKRPGSRLNRLVLRSRFEYQNYNNVGGERRTITWDSDRPRVVEPMKGWYLQAVSFSLHGYEADEYCVIYQARMKGEGNSVWCMNGATCGSVNSDVPIEGLTIFVSPIKRSEGLKYQQALNNSIEEAVHEPLNNIASDIVKKRSTPKLPLSISAIFKEFNDDPVAFGAANTNKLINEGTSEVLLKSQLLTQHIKGAYNDRSHKTSEEIIALGKAEFDKIKDKIENFLTGDDGLVGLVKNNEFTLLTDDLKNMAARQSMEDGLDEALISYAQQALPRVLETIQDLSKTFSIQFGVEAAAGIGLNAAVGFAFDPNIDHKEFALKIKDGNLDAVDIMTSLNNMEIKGLVGGGAVAGVTFGVSGSGQIGIWKTDINNMSGFSWAVNFEVPAGPVGIGLSFIFGFDPVEYQGVVISIGAGVGFSVATLSVGYTHDF